MNATNGLGALAGGPRGAAPPAGAEALAETLARLLPPALAGLTTGSVDAACVDVRAGRLDELSPDPAAAQAVFRADPSGAEGLIVADRALAAAAPAAMLGGGAADPGRPPSGLELALIERLFEAALRELTAALAAAPPPPRLRLGGLDATPAAPATESALIRLRLTWPAGAGVLGIALPVALLAPLALAVPPAAIDPRWREAVIRRLLDCALDLEATLADEALPLGRLDGLRPGALLRLAARPGDAAVLRVGGHMVGRGPLTDYAGQAAIEWRG